MRFRNKNTGAIIDVCSELKGPWEKLDGGAKPAVNIQAPAVETAKAENVSKKPAKKAKK